jgi:hypothetical protein
VGFAAAAWLLALVGRISLLAAIAPPGESADALALLRGRDPGIGTLVAAQPNPVSVLFLALLWGLAGGLGAAFLWASRHQARWQVGAGGRPAAPPADTPAPPADTPAPPEDAPAPPDDAPAPRPSPATPAPPTTHVSDWFPDTEVAPVDVAPTEVAPPDAARPRPPRPASEGNPAQDVDAGGEPPAEKP